MQPSAPAAIACPACRFGRFELQPAQRRLLDDGVAVPLGARAFDVLQVLVGRAGQLVTKHELLALVWPGLVVEENNLQVQMSALRKLLGPQAIATIPGRGYRFTATLDDAAAGTGAAAAYTPAAGVVGAARLTNLPATLPPLFGREDDVGALLALLDEHRLVTVVGAGGIGKSRLAQAAAHASTGRFVDGVWMVEMAGLAEPERLPNTVAQTLNVRTSGTGAAAVEELAAGLAQRSALLVLDNCEHLLDAAAELAQAVLRRAPLVRILTTSQEPLRLPMEQQYRVVPLAVPDAQAAPALDDARAFGAVALFEARVRAADPRFVLNDESLPLVVDVCRRLDGLPLAIELAAARVATLGLKPVRDKLDARFKLLTGGTRAALRRHQTLRAALEWSHHLLTDAEKTVFRRLGVFAGGFTVELAQAVASDAQMDEWAVLDHLSALVDKSLVVADAGDAPRYRLLESARAFALEQLADVETAATLERHAHAMRDFIVRVGDANLDGEMRTDQYAACVLPELDNLRNAYAWGTGEGGDLRVAIAIAAHGGSLIDYASECIDWLVALQPHVEAGVADAADTARYWRALAAGNLMGHVSRQLQLQAAERAVALYRRLGLPRRVVSSLIQVSRMSSVLRDFTQAQAALDEARALMRPDWPPEFRVMLLRRDGSLARDAGRYAEALALYRETLRASAATGDWRLQVIARHNLIDLLWEMGPIEAAADEATRLAADLRTQPAAENDMDMLYANVVGILAEMGRVDEATAAAVTALPLMRRSRRYFVEEWAYLFWRRGQPEAAAAMIGATGTETARTGAPSQPNEARLVAAARPALERALGPDAFAQHVAAGAALDSAGLAARIEQALAQPAPRG